MHKNCPFSMYNFTIYLICLIHRIRSKKYHAFYKIHFAASLVPYRYVPWYLSIITAHVTANHCNNLQSKHIVLLFIVDTYTRINTHSHCTLIHETLYKSHINFKVVILTLLRSTCWQTALVYSGLSFHPQNSVRSETV